MEYWNIGPDRCMALKNDKIYGETVKIDPQSLNPTPEVMRF
jgi:hypothetical protein